MRRALNVIMLLLLLLAMLYTLTINFVHEVAGTILCVCFFIHVVWNRKFYSSMFKGKVNVLRIFRIVINVSLLVSASLMFFSGFVLSFDVFSAINGFTFKLSALARVIHLSVSHWLFLFAGIHAGLHIERILKYFYKKYRFLILSRIVLLIVSAYGIYAMYKSGFFLDMLLLRQFAFFDYSKSIFLTVAQYLAALTFFISIGYYIHKLFKRAP